MGNFYHYLGCLHSTGFHFQCANSSRHCACGCMGVRSVCGHLDGCIGAWQVGSGTGSLSLSENHTRVMSAGAGEALISAKHLGVTLLGLLGLTCWARYTSCFLRVHGKTGLLIYFLDSSTTSCSHRRMTGLSTWFLKIMVAKLPRKVFINSSLNLCVPSHWRCTGELWSVSGSWGWMSKSSGWCTGTRRAQNCPVVFWNP